MVSSPADFFFLPQISQITADFFFSRRLRRLPQIFSDPADYADYRRFFFFFRIFPFLLHLILFVNLCNLRENKKNLRENKKNLREKEKKSAGEENHSSCVKLFTFRKVLFEISSVLKLTTIPNFRLVNLR